MKPESLTTGQLLRTRYPLLVPPYQRAYAWERDELSDFINDVKGLSQARANGKSGTQFFGGVVTVHAIVAGKMAGGEYRVVDGQQRLATFTLAIAQTLRAYEVVAKQADAEKATDVAQEARAYAAVERSNLLEYDEVVGSTTQHLLRVQLSRVDAEFFDQLVRGKPSDPPRVSSQRRLLYASRRLDRELVRPILSEGSWSPRQKLDALRNLVSAMTDDCQMIHIISEEPGEAYRLFATLNDRGRALSDGDLLRTRTLELLEHWPLQQAAAEQSWEAVLGGSYGEVDKFLRDRYASVAGTRAPSRGLYDRYLERFYPIKAPDSEEGADSIVQFVRQLKTEFYFYGSLRAGEWPYQESRESQWNRDRLARLVVTLGQETCLPMLLSVRCELPEETFTVVLRAMERLSFRYLISGAHAGTLGDRYYKHAELVRVDGLAWSPEAFISDVEALVGRAAPDETFRTNLRSRVQYSATTSQRRVVKHLLTTLDDFYPWTEVGPDGRLKPKAMGHYDLDAIEIEHIYPQHAKIGERDPALEESKHELGNLTFWDPTDNNKASNQPFGVKRTAYGESKVALNRELAKTSQWNIDALRARSNELARAAMLIYKLSIPTEVTDIESTDDDLLVDDLEIEDPVSVDSD